MKALIVIEIPEDHLAVTLNDLYERLKGYKCELNPMPTKKKPLFDPNHCDIEEEIKIIHEIVGYNRCVDEIMGETE